MLKNSVLCLVSFFSSTVVFAGIEGAYNRTDLISAPSKAKVLGQSVALSVSPAFIQGDSIRVHRMNDPLSFELCAEEKFSRQYSVGVVNCTGFLVAPDLLVTAGHCATNFGEVANDVTAFCTDFEWYFGFHAQPQGQVTTVPLDPKQRYKCKKIVLANYDHKAPPGTGADYALIQLDRPVKDRTPLKISDSVVRPGESISMIGYPMGLTAKFAGQARVKQTQFEHFFTSDLDAVTGDSGSPVFNAHDQVVGILVRRLPDDDIAYDQVRRCAKYSVCRGQSCLWKQAPRISGAHVQRLDWLKPLLRTLPSRAQ